MTGLAITDIAKVLNDEAAAYKLLESIRWPNGPVCPHCQSTDAHYIRPLDGATRRTGRTLKTGEQGKSYRRLYRCLVCKKQYSVLVGTIFGDSHIPLGKWLFAFHLLCSGKNGVSAHELHRQLNITVKSAWFMAHRIRYAMDRPPLSDKLQGVVEADETYFGGKAKNMHKWQREQRINGRGPSGKIPVVTLVERGGEARSRVMERVNGENIRQVLHEQVAPTAALMTDTSTVYPEAGKLFASHETVDHGAGEYARDNGRVHSNTAEGFFSQLKRSIDGTHHHVTEQHLDRYLAEFDWRYNTRQGLGVNDAERMVMTIRKTAGKRLTYRTPTSSSGELS